MTTKKIVFILVGIFTIFLTGFSLNFFILKNTAEYHQHNIYGDTDNVVFLHADGHQELVLDPDGNPIMTGPNASTYNYCHPIEEPLCHYLNDTRPWIKWGNSAGDPSTKDERKAAFRRDYWGGLKKLLGLTDQ